MTPPDAPPGGDSAEVRLDDVTVTLSNLDKVLWPQIGFTKRQMIAYYMTVAEVLLPHLRARAVTLKRYPDGVDGWFWFQNRCRNHPSWIRTQAVPATTREGLVLEYCVVDDRASLAWVANLAAVELHPLLSRDGRLGESTAAVFDLDPGPAAGVVDACRVGLRIHELLTELGLDAYPKTSGVKGMHVYVPLNSGASFDATKDFAREVARSLTTRHPEQIVDRPEMARRGGRVFVDWRQNSAARSMVAVYSLRATAFPSISTPVTWSEVDAAVTSGEPTSVLFGPEDVLSRVDRSGDLFSAVLTQCQTLPAGDIDLG